MFPFGGGSLFQMVMVVVVMVLMKEIMVKETW